MEEIQIFQSIDFCITILKEIIKYPSRNSSDYKSDLYY